MGDTTRVEIILHRDCYDNLCEAEGGEDKFLKEHRVDDVDHIELSKKVVLTRYEVTSAAWFSLEDTIKEKQYEFDKYWDGTLDFEEGSEHYRHVGKIYSYFEILDSEKRQLETLNKLLKSKDIKQAIKNLIKQIQPFVPKDPKTYKSNAELFIEHASKKE